MIDKVSKNYKQRHIKTQVFSESQWTPFQFGKPVIRLPIINKKSGALRFRYDNTIDKSLDSKQKPNQTKLTIHRDTSLNNQQSILRKYSNNSQLQLTFEELQLCTDKSKKILPKIAALGAIGAPSRQNSDRSGGEEFYKKLNRIKSEKKIDSNTSELGCYKLGAIIGRGNYSIVRLCTTNDGKKYAAKVYSKQKINTPQRETNLHQQIKILKTISHPCIISFKQHIETEQNHYIVMQAFDNISLTEYIKRTSNPNQPREQPHTYLSSEPCTSRYRQRARLSEQSARTIMRKVLDGFEYLHESGIAHRDVKLENVLIAGCGRDEVIVRVIDFGFSRRCRVEVQGEMFLADMKENKREYPRKGSKVQQQDIFYDYCGTPSYMSPQISSKKGYYARPADVWALGVMLFCMVTGNFPFKIITQKSDFNNSIFSQLNPNIKLSPMLISMLKKMLRNDPMSRPTVKQLLQKEQWLQNQF